MSVLHENAQTGKEYEVMSKATAPTTTWRELTPKKWKLVQIAGAAVAIAGAFSLSGDIPLGVTMITIGASIFAVGRAIAWWSYG